jgi:hypothetical protein
VEDVNGPPPAGAGRSGPACRAGGQFLAHLLGVVGFSAELVSLGGAALGGCRTGLGGGGALLGGGTDRFHLSLGGGGVGEDVDPVAKVGARGGDPVGFGAQRPQQRRAGVVNDYVTWIVIGLACLGGIFAAVTRLSRCRG